MKISGPFYYTLDGKRVKVEVYVDAAALAFACARKAYDNKAGRTRLAHGAIIVTADACPTSPAPSTSTGA